MRKLDEHYSSLISLTEFQGSEYYIKEVEIHNFLCYGSHNIVNFEEIKGLTGLFAENGSGKCVDPETKIEIEFDEKKIIKLLGFLPDELK